MTRAGPLSYKQSRRTERRIYMTQEELNQVAGVVTTLMKEKITELTSQFDAKIEALKPQTTPAQQDGTKPASQESQESLPGIGALIGNPFDQAQKEQPNMTDLTAQLSEQLKISQELNRKLIGSLNTPSPGTGAQQPKTAEEVLAAAIR